MKSWSLKGNVRIYQVLSGRSNAYLICNANQNILVDTGKISSFATLRKRLKSLQINISNISHLVLTHTHFDHCQSVRKIKDESNCSVVVSNQAKTFIEKGFTPLPKGRTYFSKLILKLGNVIGLSKFGYPVFTADIFVFKNRLLEFQNLKIEIIETKGHSDDSISNIINDEIAIVGDTIFGVFPKKVIPPFYDDFDEMVQSWKKLLLTNCKLFLPGHGKAIERAVFEKEYKKYSCIMNHLS